MLPPVLAPLWPLIRLVVDAVILRVVASLVPGLRIDGWLTAFIAVLIMSAAGWRMEIHGFGALLLAGLLITTLHFLPFMLAAMR